MLPYGWWRTRDRERVGLSGALRKQRKGAGISAWPLSDLIGWQSFIHSQRFITLGNRILDTHAAQCVCVPVCGWMQAHVFPSCSHVNGTFSFFFYCCTVEPSYLSLDLTVVAYSTLTSRTKCLTRSRGQCKREPPRTFNIQNIVCVCLCLSQSKHVYIVVYPFKLQVRLCMTVSDVKSLTPLMHSTISRPRTRLVTRSQWQEISRLSNPAACNPDPLLLPVKDFVCSKETKPTASLLHVHL